MLCDEAVMAAQAPSFDAVTRLIEAARTIAVCAHTSADGDALGSELALVELIERRWPEKRVSALLADDDVVPRIYQFLPGAERLVRAVDYREDPDLFVCVDLSQPGRLADARAVLERSARVAVLDHHPLGRDLLGRRRGSAGRGGGGRDRGGVRPSPR